MRGRLSSTRVRLGLAAVVIFALALLVADGAILASVALTQSQESDAVLVAQARMIASSLQDNNGQLGLGGSDLPGETESGIAVDAAVVSADAVVAQTSNQPLPRTVLLGLAAEAARAGSPVWASIEDVHHVPRRAYATPLSAGAGPADVLVVSRSVGEIQSAWYRTFLILLLVSLVLLIIGGALAYWLAGRALRPVRTIAGLARSMSERDLHKRVEVKVPPDELGELVDTFNSMLARLEASFVSLSRFTADASHELRAPLALMRSELDGALSRGRSREEYRRVLLSMQGEVDHLSRLADQLLILARADAGALVPASEPVDVADFLHETAARWAGLAEKRGIHLDVIAPSAGQMTADPGLLRRVLNNLIENALHHAPAGSTVTLRGYGAPGGWNVEVADQGPGVAPEHRARLFTRFAKADSARSREDGGGAGLGLALSAAIARAHAGTLELVDADGGAPGAVFRLHVPGGRSQGGSHSQAATPRSTARLAPR